MRAQKHLRIPVHVEAADIKAGHRGSCARCPVAIAIHRAVGLRVYVAAENIKKADGKTRGDRGNPIADLPEIATRFIEAFDAGRNVKPLRFYLRLASRDVRRDDAAGW